MNRLLESAPLSARSLAERGHVVFSLRTGCTSEVLKAVARNNGSIGAATFERGGIETRILGTVVRRVRVVGVVLKGGAIGADDAICEVALEWAFEKGKGTAA